MIFTARTRERSAEFAVAKRAAKGSDSANDPEHEQGKTRVKIDNLKSETGEDTRADNVCDHNSARGKKADRPRRGSQIRRGQVRGFRHLAHDNGTPRANS